ncbi:MAG: ABC transporter permease [Fibrobacteres bacterium]|nr:ABC transporter permease [Fibrobacterota bacterium]
MLFSLGVALRFLREGRMQTLLILVAIAVGISVQVFLSSLITGLQKDLISKTVGSSPHLTVSPQDRKPILLLTDSTSTIVRIASSDDRKNLINSPEPLIRSLRESGLFSAVSPVAEGAGFAIRGAKNMPIVIRGVDITLADSVYFISSKMVSGTTRISASTVLIGKELASELRLKVGDNIRLSSSEGRNDLFTISGIFDLEAKAINSAWVFLTERRAQSLLNIPGSITSIEMKVPSVFEAQPIKEAFASAYPEYEWVSWQENNRSLLAGLKSQSGSSLLIQVLVILAVTLGISSVLAVSAIQKARQIGILKAMGADNKRVSFIFLLMGLFLGLGGSVLGCAGGYLLIVGFLKGTAAATGQPLFPLTVSPSLFLLSGGIATAAGMIAAFIPARRSASLNPIEVIRNG